MARETTNKILELVEEGALDPMDVLVMALKYMSEEDVTDMARCNELILELADEE